MCAYDEMSVVMRYGYLLFLPMYLAFMPLMSNIAAVYVFCVVQLFLPFSVCYIEYSFFFTLLLQWIVVSCQVWFISQVYLLRVA